MRTTSPSVPTGTHQRLASLDGFRAVAIVLVLVSHANLEHLIPGGFGVTIFFFMSGYLITTLLFREQSATGRIDMAAFFVRRARRLMPPLLVTLALVYGLAWAGVIEGTPFTAASFSHLFYYANYNLLAVTENGEGIPGLGILWSLAVEEHFYLLWPGVFVLLCRVTTARARLGWLGALLLAILAWRCVVALGFGADIRRIYLATDTRIDSILWGCFLAFMQREGAAQRLLPHWAAYRLSIVAGAVFIILLTLLIRDDTFRRTLRYTLQGAALVPIFHYAVTAPKAWIFAPLNWPIASRLAVWSYTIYLIHDVIYEGLRHYDVAGSHPAAHIVIVSILSVGWAEFVLRAVERPIRARQAASSPTSTSRLPAWFGAEMTPSSSSRSIKVAARL